MEYNFPEIEKKWQKFWTEKKTFRAENNSTKPKYYVLDMFPYPSGSGLHVGHPLGYIASDIYTRYKRLKGFNVLHPMGYDAFGLPAEQYAIQTGTHPAITTATNIARYREQMDQIGFSYDWDREVKTSDPAYYKWTQWTFIQLYHHWYNNKTKKAEPIESLISIFEADGNGEVNAAVTPEWYKTLAKKDVIYGTKWDGVFTADQWNSFTEKHKQEILMNYRLAYQSDAMVNWCPALGTVLANDEVANGFSIRGGHPVERKLMRQWFLRITAYAQRLLDGLDQIDFSESLKEMQRNWIGRSEGAEVAFPIKDTKLQLDIFTTRPDTIFGATFMVIAPEHELAEKITAEAQRSEVETYLHWAKNRSERERMAEVKKVTGVFTGAYCINPLNGKEIPIWIADYVLAGYGTGAIMAVPAHDSRDYDFAKHFNLPIVEVVAGGDLTQGSYDAKDGILVNSEFINGMQVKEAIRAVIEKLAEMGIGTGTVNFRLRDAIFSRQRYWGEPFPIYYKNDIPYTLDVSKLPLELPEVDKYLPTESGDPPLARAKNWCTEEGYPYETSTMPGFAGSSGYYLRYMDPQNDQAYFSKEAVGYWQDVDLYIGGAEHATGHLIYSRFWNKFLFDLGFVVKDEPYKKLINQGMIQGVSQKARVYYNADSSIGYILPYTAEVFLTKEPTWTPMPVEYLDGNILTQENLEALKNTYKHLVPLKIATFEEAVAYAREFGFEAPSETLKSLFHAHSVALRPEVEKMSKSKYNVVNPDDLIDKYGADTLRLYEMFLGPLEQAKPWDTKGIEGVFRFIRKFWRLYHDRDNQFAISEEEATKEELKILHRTIKKVQEDIERFSFNTAVSNFMICVNELSEVKCTKRSILEPLVVLISPYAPHMAEELWQLLGHQESISFAHFPEFNASYLVENTFNYPVSFNGKMRFQMELPMDMPPAEVEKTVLASADAQKWLQGNPPKKVIVVPKKIVNVVI